MTDFSPRSVLIMAGGTGGHVFPALAAADCLREQGITVEWLGTQQGIEARLVPAANIPIHYIDVSGLRGKGLMSRIVGIKNLFKALWQAARIVRKLQPNCVLGMGGYASGPGGVAASLMGKPLVIHEQNSVAGTTNRILARFAKRVLQGYPINLGGGKGQFIGNPVRREIANIPAPEERGLGREEQLKVLVLGGSLGAKPINDILVETLVELQLSCRPEVWHQAGGSHADAVSTAYKAANLPVKVEAFIHDMAEAYAWADLVICRAGALTVAELTAAGVASILVPLPHAIDDHQTGNAQWLDDKGAGQLMPQSTMTAKRLAESIQYFNNNREALLAMSKRARALAKNNAAGQVAAACMEASYA